MTELEKFLSECERLDKEATPGPWSSGPQNSNYGHNVLADLGHRTIFSTPYTKTESGHNETSANADFTAHSRTALPLLVKMLREILTTLDDDDWGRAECERILIEADLEQ